MDTIDIILMWLGSVYTFLGTDSKLIYNDVHPLSIDLEPLPFFVSQIKKLGFMALHHRRRPAATVRKRVCVHCSQQDHSSSPNSAILLARWIGASDK